jgi:hypothetical protein
MKHITDGPPLINLLYGNTADHFAEHLAWLPVKPTGVK